MEYSVDDIRKSTEYAAVSDAHYKVTLVCLTTIPFFLEGL